MPIDGWLKEPEGGLHVIGPKAFAELMEKLGVSDDMTVVAYDDNNMFYATRLWWALSYYGHTNVRVHNGVWYRWLTEGRPVTFKVMDPEPGHFIPHANESVICRLDYVKSKLDDPETQILDVRPDGEWSGQTNDFKNKRVGHIPGALHIFAQKFVTDDERRMVKPESELHNLLKDAGVQPGKEVIVHCRPESVQPRVCSSSDFSAGTGSEHMTWRSLSGQTGKIPPSWSSLQRAPSQEKCPRPRRGGRP